MPGSAFRTLVAPADLDRYVRDAGLTLIDAEGDDAPWGLMYVRKPDGGSFAAIRSAAMSTKQVECCIAIAIAHAVLGHEGDFVHAADGAALAAPSSNQATAATRYGALLLARRCE